MFKKDDVVVCVRVKGVHLTLDKEYIVLRDVLDMCTVRITDDKGRVCSFYLDRFKLKQEQEEMTYDELYGIAMLLDIRGRSGMNKAELEAAIPARKNGIPKAPKPAPVVVPLSEQLRAKTGNTPGTCSYAWRSAYKEALHVADVCHARLRSESPMLEIVLDVAGHYNNHSNKEAYQSFVMWMLVSSPFRSCFVTKDWKAAITTGVQLDVTKSHSNNVAAAIALRAASEFEYRAILFHSLVNRGYSHYVAWIASAYFREISETEFCFYSCAAAHDIHHGLIPLAVMKRFHKEGFLYSDAASNVKAAQYTAVKSICGIVEYELENNDQTLKAFLLKEAGIREIGLGWGKSFSNINTRVLFKTCEALEEVFK